MAGKNDPNAVPLHKDNGDGQAAFWIFWSGVFGLVILCAVLMSLL